MGYDYETIIEEVEINGEYYEVNVTVFYDGKTVDNGIGPYEFWGSKGTDVRMETEIDIEDIEVNFCKDDNDDKVKFAPEITKAAIENHFKEYPQAEEWIVSGAEDDFEGR